MNTAVNTVVTNEVIMREMSKGYPMQDVAKEMIMAHKQGGMVSELTYDCDIIRELEIFLSSEGCRVTHGDRCFKACREKYDRNVNNISILKEINRLASLENEIGDSRSLKGMLEKQFSSFRGNIQHDAGDAFLSMLEIIPSSEGKFNLIIRATRKCLKCGNVKVKDELSGIMNLNYLNCDNRVRTLQEAVGEFCN